MADPRNVRPRHQTVDDLIALIPTWEENSFSLAGKNVTLNQLNALAEALANKPEIKHLNLSNNCLRGSSAELLQLMPGVQALLNSPHLQSLNLDDNSLLYDEACTYIMNYAPIGLNLTKLSLAAEITVPCRDLLARVATQRQEQEANQKENQPQRGNLRGRR